MIPFSLRMQVAYLVDIFRVLVTLKQGMQGRATTLIEASDYQSARFNLQKELGHE